jgi:hypothetical protein
MKDSSLYQIKALVNQGELKESFARLGETIPSNSEEYQDLQRLFKVYDDLQYQKSDLTPYQIDTKEKDLQDQLMSFIQDYESKDPTESESTIQMGNSALGGSFESSKSEVFDSIDYVNFNNVRLNILSDLDKNNLDSAVRNLDKLVSGIPNEKVREIAQRIREDLEELRQQENSKKGLPRNDLEAAEFELRNRTQQLVSDLDPPNDDNDSFQFELPDETLKTTEDFGETPAEEEEPGEQPTPSPPTLLDVQTRMENDQWAKEDLLGYQTYAEVIANMILDDLSQPPLAIGIIAPWGHGKTTLMHYVRLRLQEGKRPEPKQQGEDTGSSMDALMTYSDRRMADSDDVQKWMKELDQLEEGKKIDYDIPGQGLPTIWFNPWQYQSSEQIWAGMAHALIQQLVARLSPKEREKFYFQLHLRRVDRNAIRQDIHRTTILSLLPALAIILLSFLLYGFLVAQPTNLPSWLVVGLPGGLTLAGLIQGGLSWWNNARKGLVDKYDKYFQQPDYENNLGMYHEVQEDLLRVFDLLVEDDKPAVIFIDDLDRCSPQKVAEVIEAINLLMNGSYRNKCYFVLGMDAQIVAAALDVAYKDMYGRLDNRARTAGSIGWYFLDKFIQLPFFIPTLDKDEKTRYLRRLFGDTGESLDVHTEARPLPDEETMRKMVKEDVDRAKRGQSSKVKRRRSKQEQTQMDRLFIEVVLEESKDSRDIVEQLQIYAPYLEDSPRGLKRFANLLRFYTAIQQLRIRDGLSYASTESLAKWLTISLRWPQFVRWLQWSQEEHQLTVGSKNEQQTIQNQVHGLAPTEKAQRLDMLLDELPAPNGEPEQVATIFQEDWLGKMSSFPQVPWLSDIELFDILYRKRTVESKLEQAVEVDIW